MDNIEYATIKEKCIDLEISYFRCSDQDPILFLGKVTEPLPFKNYMIVNLIWCQERVLNDVLLSPKFYGKLWSPWMLKLTDLGGHNRPHPPRHQKKDRIWWLTSHTKWLGHGLETGFHSSFSGLFHQSKNQWGDEKQLCKIRPLLSTAVVTGTQLVDFPASLKSAWHQFSLFV